MTTRRAQRREIRRKAIVEAAADVFAEVGIHAATLDQIGERVGLSKASLYYYVESKDQLTADVLQTVLDDIDRRAEALIEPGQDVLEQLRMHAWAHVETGSRTPAGRMILGNLDALVNNKASAALMRRHEEPAIALLKAAREQGLMRDVDIDCTVKLLYGALNNIPRWYRPRHGSLDHVFEQTWSIFIRGIAVG